MLTTLAKKNDLSRFYIREEAKVKENKIGTWNVERIYEDGVMIILALDAKKHKMELIAIQETHVKQSSTRALIDYIFFTSGGQTRRYEIGYLIRNKLKDNVKNIVPVTERLCYIDREGELNMQLLKKRQITAKILFTNNWRKYSKN